MFEWDEEKRVQTIRKHKIDFVDAIQIFANDPVVLSARSDLETRQIALGPLAGKMIAIVFTMRGDVIRIITVRRARKNEEEHYEAIFTGRRPGDQRSN